MARESPATAAPRSPAGDRARVLVLGGVRLALLSLCAVLLALAAPFREGLPWLLAFAAAGALTAPRRASASMRASAVALEVLVVCLGILGTGGSTSELLPYVVAPLAAAGYLFGNRGAVLATAVAAGVLVGGELVPETERSPVDVAVLGQWLALGLGGGLLAAWAQRLASTSAAEVQPRFLEARRLLAELRSVARDLPGGLDAAAAAANLLEGCSSVVHVDRGIVLTIQESADNLVPLAVRGVDRVPWRDPVKEPGTLRRAWASSTTVLDVRPADLQGGRRQGSALLVLPLLSITGRRLGLVALESYRLDAFTTEVITVLEHLVEDESVRVETALLFADLRHTATLEERERLAREMHNGVAQDLAYFGFELDGLRHRLEPTDPEHAGEVARLRRELTQLIQDIRLSISDLRASVGPDRGLGTALSNHVRLAGNAAGLTVHLTVLESGFRLPADQEMALFRVAQAFVNHARRAPGARNLWLSLQTDPPWASLSLEHDAAPGQPPWAEAEKFAENLQPFGTLQVSEPDGRVRVDVQLGKGASWRSDSSSSTTTR
jgi:signal transduction histidine kinase